MHLEMAETSDYTYSDNDALGALYEAATEIGVVAEDIFKNATAALYAPYAESIRSIAEAERHCAQMQYDNHQRVLGLLAACGAEGEHLRSIIALQQISLGFARIAYDGRQIAELSLALMGDASELLAQAGDDGSLLLHLIRQTYVEVRGGVLAVTLRDPAIARRVVAEDAALDGLFLIFKSMLDRAILSNPRAAAPLQRLLLIGIQLEDIGNRIVGICKALM
ncbi:MAG TPA: hypothetical protein VF510_12210 [Ktedonobacterales bacterium]